ncbi:MAG TPA: type II secretion system F family protein [Phycisphaerae bacterium]|nr:type II secretion system F family protein [Phycisphaerae bacterium]
MNLFVFIVFFILTAAVLAVVLQVVFGSWLGWAKWLPFRGGLLGGFLLYRQTSLALGVVHHLASITNLHLPLAHALTTTGRSERGALGLVLRRMGKSVAEGIPLSRAYGQATRDAPPLVTSVIAAGEHAGQLPRALADLERALTDQLEAETPSLSPGRRYWLYPVALVLGNALLLAWVMVFIVPKFEEIFLDFDTELPGITRSLIAVSEWFVTGVPPGIVLVGMVLVFLVAVAIAIGLAFREAGETMTQVVLDMGGWIPLLSRPVAFGKGMSVSLRVVRMGLAAGMPLSDAAALAASVRVNRFVRRRWVAFARQIEQGVPASEAARSAGLGSMFAWACRSLERGNADPQVVLAHAADYHRALAFRWWRALGRAAWPAVTCLLGCMVGYSVLGLFLPLVTLINSVSGG